MRNNGHLILRMCGNYALVTFPGNPNVYGVLPENILDFRAKYRSVLSWRGVYQKEEEKDEIYFLCKMYRTLKEKDEIPAKVIYAFIHLCIIQSKFYLVTLLNERGIISGEPGAWEVIKDKIDTDSICPTSVLS